MRRGILRRPISTTCASLIAALAGTFAAAELPDTPVPDNLESILVEALQPRYVAPTLRDRIGRIWAPVYINDKGPFRLVLDTGANRSAVIHRVVHTLGHDAPRAGNAQLRGTTGTAVVPMVGVGRLQIGDLVMEGTELPILPDAFGGADGVLGYDGLRDKRIFIDFQNDLITIKRSRRELPGENYVALPMSFVHDFVPAVTVSIRGTRVKAIIDTGAQRSFGNLALLDLLKRRNPELVRATITGVTLDQEVAESMLIPGIRMGPVTIPSLQVAFSDLYIFEHWKLTDTPVLMLGMDVLGTVDKLVLDYRRREMHLKARLAAR
jgi:hypothetical protein